MRRLAAASARFGAPVSRTVRVVLVCLALPAGTLAAPHARAQPEGAAPAPLYALEVEADLTAHTLTGTVRIRLDAEDPRARRDTWLLHLPPNRFQAPDPRGPRRYIAEVPFAGESLASRHGDPLEPEGFSSGGIDLLAVETAAGEPLRYSLEDNPQIPQGYSVRDGLLRVHFGPRAKARELVIRFRTRLPHRYWEGWSEAGVLVEHWHPVLANPSGDAWEASPFEPRAGRYTLDLTATGRRRLVLGPGDSAIVGPERPYALEAPTRPLRSLALVLAELRSVEVSHRYDVSLYAYHRRGHARLARQAVDMGQDFLDFLRERYRLRPPGERIVIVERPGPPLDLRTVGNLVLVPSVYFQNSALLDRVFLAKLSRAVAQVWFGQGVWAHEDRQAWLHLGVAGFLALDYFETRFGWDAGIHSIMDWLRPRLREHFYELPVRRMIRRDADAPLLISLHGYEPRRSAMLALHHKAPLVLRSLAYVVGRETFARGLNALYYRHRFSEVTHRTLQAELNGLADEPVDGFIDAWFEGTPEMDFFIEGWTQNRAPTGYEVTVEVARRHELELPVTLEVTSTAGEVRQVRWDGAAPRASFTFALQSRVERIVLDPQEYWLEVERRNNYHESLYRVRPFFDWAKQREVLIAVQGKAGGNAIDGNYVGLGVQATLSENNWVELIPIYGERTGLRNYEASWHLSNVLLPRLSLRFTADRLGGSTRNEVSASYTPVESDTTTLAASLSGRTETVDEVSFFDGVGLERQEQGGVNSVAASQTLELSYALGITEVSLDERQANRRWDSAFAFSSYRADVTQSIYAGADHQLTLQLTRATTVGKPPAQYRHALGGPSLLRGYPRTLALTNEEIAAARLDYGIVLSRAILGSSLQTRRFRMILFADTGRGWDHGETPQDRPSRQDVGLGFEVQANMLSLSEFPIRVDVAYPYDDEEYEEPQVILLGVLNF